MAASNITDADIRTVIDAFVAIANDTSALVEVLNTARIKRSLGVRILGTSSNEGFIIEGGKIRRLHRLDNPTVTVTTDKATFWYIINSPSAKVARLRAYQGIFSEETVHVDPPPGVEGGALHIEGLLMLFGLVAESAMGGG